MLELRSASGMHRHRRTVNMQFSHNAHVALQLLSEYVGSTCNTSQLSYLPRFSQSQQSDQDVLLRVFVRQERLPSMLHITCIHHTLHLPHSPSESTPPSHHSSSIPLTFVGWIFLWISWMPTSLIRMSWQLSPFIINHHLLSNQIRQTLECELSKRSCLHSRGHKRHWDIPLF